MPTEMTFTSLQADLQSYLQRGTSVDPLVFNQLPKLINNGERRIFRELKILGVQTPMTSVFVANQAAQPKPDRWRATISMNFGTLGTGGQLTKRNPILPRSYEYCIAYAPDDNVFGPPQFYADWDYSNWRIAPVPDQAYPFEVLSWMQPALLDANNTTNWLSLYAPDLLLYAALCECAPFIVNDARVPVWEQAYKDRIGTVKAEDIQKIIDRDSHRDSA